MQVVVPLPQSNQNPWDALDRLIALAVLQDFDHMILDAAAKEVPDPRILQETLEGHPTAFHSEEGLHHVLSRLRGELAAGDQDQHLRQNIRTLAERLLTSSSARPEAN